MTFSHSEVRAYYSARVPSLRITNGKEWRGPCPVHQGKDDNFAVNAETGLAQCHSQCGRGWDLISLEQDLTGAAFPAAKSNVYSIVGRAEVPWEDRDIEATYDYTDEKGQLLYQVVRRHGKKFSQRRPDGRGGWLNSIKGIARVPYNLPNIVAASNRCVFITEGEKDANTLNRLGLVATCNNGGAEHFGPELAPWFVGRHVAILPDNDDKGRSHALMVAALLAPVAASVRIVELPNLPAKGDVTDFVNTGGTVDQIKDRYKKAQQWTADWQFAIDVPAEDDKYVQTIEQALEAVGGLTAFWNLAEFRGLETPWPRLNSILNGGMRNGEVYVIGANQGSGKTSLALQFGIAAMRHDHGVLMFSMEMPHASVFQRMAAIEARVNLMEFRELQVQKRNINEYLDKLARATAELAQHKLQVSTKASVTPKYIIAETKRLSKRSPVDLVIVDHMQLMGSGGDQKSDYEKFTAISRAMKQTAMEVGVPVLVVSQTSRHNSKEHRAELDVSDLRGSGAIEEDAAGVFLLYEDKDDVDAAKAVDNGSRYLKGPVKSWLKVGKNRYGLQQACLPLLHSKTYTRFDLMEVAL